MLDPDRLASGAALFLLGYIQKAYVADTFGRWLVNPVFAAPTEYGALGHWVSVVGYALQVFNDFAGYSIMAIGLGRFFGVELPRNFDMPFFAKSLIELWRRWHITLNNWLFDYLYTPLTTSRGWWRGRAELAFLLVFLLSGLWHGAAWGFVIWGVLHGVGLVVRHRWDLYYKSLCRQDRVWVKRRKSRAYGFAALVLTQVFFVFTLGPFRGASWAGARDSMLGMFGAFGAGGLPTIDSGTGKLNLACALVFVVGYHVLGHPKGRRLLDGFLALPAPVRGAAYGGAVLFLGMFLPAAGGTFVYAQF